MIKKILFVINTLGGAGAEKALIELLKRFSPEEYEVSLYVLLGQGELIHQIPSYVTILNNDYVDASVLSEEGKKQLKKRTFKRLFKKFAIFKNIPYLLSNMIQMIKKGRIHPDKLLWRIVSDSACEISKHYDMAVAYLEGGSTYFVHDHIDADRKFTFMHVDYEYAGYSRKLDKDCYLDFDRIFAVSDEVKQSLLKVYPERSDKIFVFHNLIDQKEIKRKAKFSGGFEDDYDGMRLLTVGRLTSQKAYEIAIDAMKLLKDQHRKVRWYVLGEGELRQKLQRQIDRLGLTQDFVLLGAKENPYPYYAQCDIYVHATRFEGKSIAVQEAQILGCAIIVSDSHGNREQVEDDIDGKLCQLTPESISEKIEYLLDHKEIREQLGERAAGKLSGQQQNIQQYFQI